MDNWQNREREILTRDIDPDFLETALVSLAWEYDSLFERLAADAAIPSGRKIEEFGRHRGYCAERSLVFACEKYGVPFSYRPLGCNGQNKIIVRAGRVLLIPESIISLREKPRASEYKIALAGALGVMRQLEFDLKEKGRSHIDLDPTGDVFAVLLHGPAGPRFDRESRALGGVMLAVPDRTYESWTIRLDVREIAHFGRKGEMLDYDPSAVKNPEVVQHDNVFPTLKIGVFKEQDGVA